MLRYDRQTKPGLVALYDIRPGNGAGPFLQPRSPHGAISMRGQSSLRNHPPMTGQCAKSGTSMSIHQGKNLSQINACLLGTVLEILNYCEYANSS